MIEINELSVAYSPARPVLSSVSMKIRPGEFVVLLGRSGAGKSSLLRAINFLIRPTGGTITADGIGSLGDKQSLRRHRRRTGMIFQQHQLILRLTALDNVLMGCLGRYASWRSLLPFRHADVALALECLERVGLPDYAFRRADELSGGERQRVGIARALAQQPQLLLVDEPVASLDPQTADRIMALLRDICRGGGLTAMVSLHQLDLARRYGDRIVALAGGRVVFDGAAAELTDGDLLRVYGSMRGEDDERSPGADASTVAARADANSLNQLEQEVSFQDD